MKKLILNILLIFAIASIAFVMNNNTASAQNKPTVLLISMQGCGACRQFEPIYNSAKAKFAQKFLFVKEGPDSSRAKSLHVTETPSVFIMDGGSSQKIEWSCLSQPGCFEKTLDAYKVK